MAALEFDVRLHMEQLTNDIQQINSKIDGFVQNTKKGAGEIDNQFSKIAGLVAGYFSLNFAGNLVKQIATVRGEFQQLEVAFETMLGNKLQADQLMQQVVQFAATTPFELQEVAGGAKQLLAYGVAADQLLPTLKSLGDVSAGLSVPIERLIMNFGQVKTQAQLTGKELRDFNVAGVPIVAELAKNLNKTEQEIQEMVSAGNIGFNEVAEAFRTMSSEGGRFNNLMDKQAGTITGQISNLKDSWNQMMNSIGESNEGTIGKVLEVGKGLVENYEKVIAILKVLVVTYGAYKTAVILANVAMGAGNIPMVIKNLQSMVTSLKTATTAWKTMDAATKATAIGAAIAGIVMLVSAIAQMNKAHKEAAQESVRYQNELNGEIYKVEEAFKAVKTANEGTDERKQAIDNLNKQFGPYLKNMLTEKSTLDEIAAAQRGVTAAIAETITARYKEEKTADIQKDYTKAQEKTAENTIKITDKLSGTEANKQTAQFEAKIAELAKELEKSAIDETGYSVQTIQEKVTNIFKSITGKTLGLTAASKLANSLADQAGRAKEAADNTRNLNEQTQEYLKTLGVTEQQLTGTSGEIKKTVSDQISSTTKALSDAKTKLAEMRKSTATSSPDEIAAQEDAIKNLEKQLTTLTGISQKSINKQVKAETDAQKERERLADDLLKLETDTQAARIAIMQDGTEKQLREVDLQLQNQIAAIEKQKTELLKSLKESTLKIGTPEYQIEEKKINDLTSEQAALATAEAEKKKQEIAKASAEVIKGIWMSITETMRTEQQNEIAANSEKWDEIIKKARDAGSEEAAISAEVQKSRNEQKINAKYYLDQIANEEKIALKKAELDKKNLGNVEKTEKAKQKIVIFYAQKRLAYLSKVDKEGFKDEIQAILDGLNELDTTTGDGILDKSYKWLDAYMSIADSVGQIDAGLGEMMGKMGNLVGQGLDFAKSLKTISADPLSAITTGVGLVASVISMISESWKDVDVKFSERFEKIKKDLEDAANSLSEAFEATSSVGLTDYSAQIELTRRMIYTLADAMEDLNKKTKKYDLQLGGSGLIDIFNPTYLIDMFDKMKSELPLLVQKLLLIPNTSSNEEVRKALQDTINAYNTVIKSLEDTLNQLTGTSVDSLQDSLVDVFYQGEKAAISWGETIDDIIKNIIINQFKAEVLQKPLTDAMLNFMKWSQDGIDSWDLSAFKYELQSIMVNAKDDWKLVEEALLAAGISLSEVMEDAASSFDTGSIADSIVDGFRQGYQTAEEFAGDFEEMMKDAIIQALKTKIQSDAIFKQFYDQLTVAEEGGLTQEEIWNLRQTWNNLIATAKQIYQDTEAITGMGLTTAEKIADNDSSLTGSIKGMSEEQAGILTGQFFAMRDNLVRLVENSNQWAMTDGSILLTAVNRVSETNANLYMRATEQLDIANRSQVHLANIERNTADIALLSQTNNKLDEMNKYLKALI